MKNTNSTLNMKLAALILLLGGLLCLSVSKVMAAPPETAAEYKHNEDMRASMKVERASDQVDAEATLRKATDLYAAMVQGEHGQVPESVLSKARCVAVIPEVITGAVIVGGSHGVGVASCKENNIWSQPAFLRLSSISLGAQIGGKSSDLVLFMISEQAKTALKAGRIRLGADLSVAAGTFERGLDASTHQVIAYSRTQGAFAGASLSGGTMSGDDDTTAAFYGENIEFASLLAGDVRTEDNVSVERFTALLPQ